MNTYKTLSFKQNRAQPVYIDELLNSMDKKTMNL